MPGFIALSEINHIAVSAFAFVAIAVVSVAAHADL
jgi:hypothetical protein